MQRSIDPVEVENVFNLIQEDEDLAFFLRTAVTSIPEVVQALLDAGADPKARSEAGLTPFELIPDDSPLKGAFTSNQKRSFR